MNKVEQRGFQGIRGVGVILADGAQWIIPNRTLTIHPVIPSVGHFSEWASALANATHEYSWGPDADRCIGEILARSDLDDASKALAVLAAGLTLQYTLTHGEIERLLTLTPGQFDHAVEALTAALNGGVLPSPS